MKLICFHWNLDIEQYTHADDTQKYKTKNWALSTFPQIIKHINTLKARALSTSITLLSFKIQATSCNKICRLE